MSFALLNGVTFNQLELIEEEKIFSLINSESGQVLNVEIISNDLDKSLDDKTMKIFFFHNIYLQAENDVFQVFEKDLNKRIGWIFPLQTILSLDNDFVENVYFNKYRFSTYKELLSNGISHKEISIDSNVIYRLSDLYHDDILIFCVSMETVKDLSDFSINDYLPAFNNYGYYIFNESLYINSFNENKKDIILENKGNEKLYIKKSNINIDENTFISNLYNFHLKKIEDTTLKFFLLYQVIEYFIEKEFNKKFDESLEKFNAKLIDKNSFRENINEISKERSLIRLFTMSIDLPGNLKTSLLRDLRLFLDLLTNDYKKVDIGDLIYDLRNILVHRYRDIDALNPEDLKTFDLITTQLEFVINHYLINYRI